MSTTPLFTVIAEIEDCVRAGKAALSENLPNSASACFAKAATLSAEVRHRLVVLAKSRNRSTRR